MSKTENLQVENALMTLSTIDLGKVKPEGLGDAISQVISASQELLRLAKSLPPEQRAAVEAQALRAALEVGTVLSAGVTTEIESRRKKEYEDVLRLIQEGPQTTDIIKQQEAKLTKEAFTADLVLTGKMTVEEAKEFAALSRVLDIPEIAKEFLPFEKKAALVKKVFEPEKAAEFLRRDIEVNAVQQVLTGYADFGADMPDLTKSMIDSFRDVGKNNKYLGQCDEFQKDLEANCKVIEATCKRLKAEGGHEEELANYKKELEDKKRGTQETINGRFAANNAIYKAEFGTKITHLGQLAEKAASKAEGQGKENISEHNIGSAILELLRKGKQESRAEAIKNSKNSGILPPR